MFIISEYRELRNGERYQASIERIMSDHGSTEEIANGNSSENVEREVSEIQTLTQEAVNEQIIGFIAPLTRQLEELTRLVQAMTTSRRPNFYPTTDLGNTSDTAMPQSDMWKSMRDFYQFMITYSSEQKFDLKYSWKILH